MGNICITCRAQNVSVPMAIALYQLVFVQWWERPGFKSMGWKSSFQMKLLVNKQFLGSGMCNFNLQAPAGKLRPTIPLCEGKGSSTSVNNNSWLIYWMLNISHLTLDFPLPYLQIQGLPMGHKVTGLLQWVSHLTHDGQRRWLKRHSKRWVPGSYLLLTWSCSSLSSKLQLPDLYTFQTYWWLAIFAIGLLTISCCSKWQG